MSTLIQAIGFPTDEDRINLYRSAVSGYYMAKKVVTNTKGERVPACGCGDSPFLALLDCYKSAKIKMES